MFYCQNYIVKKVWLVVAAVATEPFECLISHDDLLLAMQKKGLKMHKGSRNLKKTGKKCRTE